MNPSLVLGLAHIGAAAVLILISIPLIMGKVKMNRWYGVRIDKAFQSEDNWYKINAYGGRRLVAWALVLAAIGVATCFLPLGTAAQPNNPLVLLMTLAPLIVLVPWVVQILRYAKKM